MSEDEASTVSGRSIHKRAVKEKDIHRKLNYKGNHQSFLGKFLKLAQACFHQTNDPAPDNCDRSYFADSWPGHSASLVRLTRPRESSPLIITEKRRAEKNKHEKRKRKKERGTSYEPQLLRATRSMCLVRPTVHSVRRGRGEEVEKRACSSASYTSIHNRVIRGYTTE